MQPDLTPLTYGQIERTLSQRIQTTYREQIGHRPSKVICHFFHGKLAIVLENTVSPVERTLIDAGCQKLAQRLRSALDAALKPFLKTLVVDIVGIPIAALLIDSDLESGFSSITVILIDVPPVRSSESYSRERKEKLTASSNQL